MALLSHALWVRRYGTHPEIVGKAIEVSGDSMQVVGVLPQGFAFREREIWIDNEWDFSAMFGGFSGFSVARMASGVGIDDVARDLNAQIAAFDTVYRGQDIGRLLHEGQVRALPMTLAEQTIGGVEETLWILLGSVGFVLLTACANVANLFLVRSEARRRETAVRMALGASRGRLMRMFLGERDRRLSSACRLPDVETATAAAGDCRHLPVRLLLSSPAPDAAAPVLPSS